MSRQNDYPSNSEILSCILDSNEGAFLNTDGIRYDLDGQGMLEYLEGIGIKTIQNWDARRNGYVLCENGLLVSTNGYAHKTDGTGVHEKDSIPDKVFGPEISIASREVQRGLPGFKRRMVEGFVLASGDVLLESERDAQGRYCGGAGMNGMYLRTDRLFMPERNESGEIHAFREVMLAPIKERKAVKKHTDLER